MLANDNASVLSLTGLIELDFDLGSILVYQYTSTSS
jgi:hypothetical protein